MKKIVLTLIVFGTFLKAQSQVIPPGGADSASYLNLSIEELLNVEISVASRKALALRESPGIVTLITREELLNSGAHDLLDILRMVPGIHFGVDVEGVVGIGIRGNWGHEGKILLLLDGQEMNEQLFGTLQFGEHYPIDQIQKIEIIRGPGSSMYGGNAEYAVINIITSVNSEYEGFAATASYGQMEKTFAGRSVSVNGGRHFGAWSVNAGLYGGEGNRSDRIFTDHTGTEFDMAPQSRLRNWLFNFFTSYKGLSLRLMADRYMNENRAGYDLVLQESEPVSFNSIYADLTYTVKLSNKFSMAPQLKYRLQEPWKVYETVSPDDAPYFRQARKPSANLTLHYDPRSNLSLDAGAEYVLDEEIDHLEGAGFTNGDSRISYTNTAFFFQGLWSTRVVNLTVGTRYHLNSNYDPSFVPRVGITKVVRRAHFKVLYSAAYRTPSIENIQLGNSIEPEKTNVAEFETGYKFSENSYLTANIYDITTWNAIVYFYEDGAEGYNNTGSTGTRGFEIDYKIKSRFGYADMNIAWYSAQGKRKTCDYKVSSDDRLLLAFPGLMANFQASIRLNDYWRLNPSTSWIGSRYDFDGIDAEGVNTYRKMKPFLLANLFAGLQHPRFKRWSASAGCANILNAKGEFIQPYSSNHEPLPGRSREFRLTLRYDWEKSKN